LGYVIYDYLISFFSFKPIFNKNVVCDIENLLSIYGFLFFISFVKEGK